MTQFKPQFNLYGQRSILVEWPSKIDENILVDMLSFKKTIENHYNKQILYINHAYSSLLIVYNTTIDKINDRISTLKTLYLEKNEDENIQADHWIIPVCYDETFGLDLEELSVKKNMSKDEIITKHTAPIYRLYFIGFLPGFFYLGGLDKLLQTDRKSHPRQSVLKGAVGIGGSQTGIYPSASPGGWNIIGNSPIDFFDINVQPHCFAKAGDGISFKAISIEEHEKIKHDINHGMFNAKSLLVNTFNND